MLRTVVVSDRLGSRCYSDMKGVVNDRDRLLSKVARRHMREGFQVQNSDFCKQSVCLIDPSVTL